MQSAVGSPWEMYLTKTIYSPQQYWVKVKGQQQLRAEETYRFNGQKANIKNGNFVGVLKEDKVYQLGKHC